MNITYIRNTEDDKKYKSVTGDILIVSITTFSSSTRFCYCCYAKSTKYIFMQGSPVTGDKSICNSNICENLAIMSFL